MEEESPPTLPRCPFPLNKAMGKKERKRPALVPTISSRCDGSPSSSASIYLLAKPSKQHPTIHLMYSRSSKEQ